MEPSKQQSSGQQPGAPTLENALLEALNTEANNDLASTEQVSGCTQGNDGLTDLEKMPEFGLPAVE